LRSLPSRRYDYDADPQEREWEPAFYGYIPDAGWKRTVVFMLMVTQSALLIILRSVCAALLIGIGKTFFVAAMVIDMAIYFLQKIIRKDGWYVARWREQGGRVSANCCCPPLPLHCARSARSGTGCPAVPWIPSSSPFSPASA
jgi:hypothetical protein